VLIRRREKRAYGEDTWTTSRPLGFVTLVSSSRNRGIKNIGMCSAIPIASTVSKRPVPKGSERADPTTARLILFSSIPRRSHRFSMSKLTVEELRAEKRPKLAPTSSTSPRTQTAIGASCPRRNGCCAIAS